MESNWRNNRVLLRIPFRFVGIEKWWNEIVQQLAKMLYAIGGSAMTSIVCTYVPFVYVHRCDEKKRNQELANHFDCTRFYKREK